MTTHERGAPDAGDGELKEEPQVAENQSAGDVLVVDDTPANLKVLAGMLKARGYRVRPVPSGALALRAARAFPPDIVLLDINMPKMDGYEVCREFKADKQLSGIPIIFVSALSEVLDKEKAFNAGGVDYVTKPFQLQEVRARVDTHLKLRRLQLELEAQNREMQESYAKLRELEQLRDGLTHMVVHDMRSPLQGIVMFLDFLKDDLKGQLSERSAEDIDQAVRSSQLLATMVDDLLSVSRMESGKMPLEPEETALAELVEGAVESLSGLTRDHDLSCEVPSTLSVSCDRELIRRVLVNLLANALKFTPRKGSVEVTAEPKPEAIRIVVRDGGPGVPDEYKERIFEKFAQADAKKKAGVPSTGLGLTFCKLAVEAHGGRIGIDDADGGGSLFWFELPVFGAC